MWLLKGVNEQKQMSLFFLFFFEKKPIYFLAKKTFSKKIYILTLSSGHQLSKKLFYFVHNIKTDREMTKTLKNAQNVLKIKKNRVFFCGHAIYFEFLYLDNLNTYEKNFMKRCVTSRATLRK